MAAAGTQGAPGERRRHPAGLPRGARPIWVLALLGLLAAAGIAGLCALGLWQLERRAWKLDLIQRVEERIHATPLPAPDPASWEAGEATDAEYRHVRLAGSFLNDREAQVRAVTALGGGYWVMTPFLTSDGFTVLVNRGFVPAERRDPATRPAGGISGETVVTGLMRLSEPKGGFLNTNDPGKERWYSRDVAAIAEARGLRNAAPYFVDADAGRDSGPDSGEFPVGGLTVINFPNNHLIYALTWFALALMLAGGAVIVARSEHRLRHGRHGEEA